MTVFTYAGARTTGLLGGTSGVQTLGDVGLNGGRVRAVCDTQEVAAAEATSTIWFARLPSNARILHPSQISWDDLASIGSPTLDIGTFNPTGFSGLTNDDNSLNDGLDLATLTLAKALLLDHANTGKRLWELAGATSDPKQMIDIKGTIQDASTNIGATLSWCIFYTID